MFSKIIKTLTTAVLALVLLGVGQVAQCHDGTNNLTGTASVGCRSGYCYCEYTGSVIPEAPGDAVSTVDLYYNFTYEGSGTANYMGSGLWIYDSVSYLNMYAQGGCYSMHTLAYCYNGIGGYSLRSVNRNFCP